tara:strand:+ start:5115 stop:5234 length:120 start_codon:yes stop_codon:yes gene_type:complete
MNSLRIVKNINLMYSRVLKFCTYATSGSINAVATLAFTI